MTTRRNDRWDDSKCSEDGERLRVRMRSLEAGQDVAGPDECQYTHTRFQDVVGFIPDSGQRERHGAKTLGVAAPRRWRRRVDKGTKGY